LKYETVDSRPDVAAEDAIADANVPPVAQPAHAPAPAIAILDAPSSIAASTGDFEAARWSFKRNGSNSENRTAFASSCHLSLSRGMR
jgi:hypothetical protein